MSALTVLKFELKNVIRSRWVLGYFLVIFFIGTGFRFLSSDPNKILVSLSLVMPVLIPLFSLLFTTLHWYYNERFTVLLMTQPISRQKVILSRYFALAMALSIAVTLGLFLPMLYKFVVSPGLLLLILVSIVLSFIFVGLGLAISAYFSDRLKGIGVAFGFWLYLALIHDGILLVLLIVFRESPMDFVAGLFSSLNPISLSRVFELIFFDQALLLGHTGALVRGVLTSSKGIGMAVTMMLLWVVMPLFGALKIFLKKDL